MDQPSPVRRTDLSVRDEPTSGPWRKPWGRAFLRLVMLFRILISLRDTGVIAGAISGRALYDGAIDLAAALKALGT